MKSRGPVVLALRRPSVVAAFSLTALVVPLAESAAQHDRQAIMVQDDGAGPSVSFFGSMDFGELRQPDFLLRDLPIFVEKLVLSDEQKVAVQHMIEAYLAEFEKLKLENLPKPPKQQQFVFAMPGIALGGGEHGEQGEAEIGGWQAGPPPDIEMDAFEDGMPMDGSVDIAIHVGMPVDGEAEMPDFAGGDGGPMVAIQIASPDGEDIPEEVRKRFEEAAAKIAEQFKEQLEKQIAEGNLPGGPGDHAHPELPDIDEMQSYQREMTAKADAFRSAKARLRQTFVMQAQDSLAPPQVERWPSLERALTREKTLPKGRLSGERNDLVKSIAKLELGNAEQTKVNEQLEAYEFALDTALQVRNDYFVDANTKVDQAMQANDPDKALTIIDRATALRIAVRSVNTQFTEALMSLLPGDKGQEFRSAVLREAYPQVYGSHYGKRAFTAAGKIEDLNDDTRKSIAGVEKAYFEELEIVDAHLRQTIDRHQPGEPRRAIEHVRDVMAGAVHEMGPMGPMMGGGDDPVSGGFQRRRELDEKYVKMLRELLTPEQAERLPKARSRKVAEPMIIQIPGPGR